MTCADLNCKTESNNPIKLKFQFARTGTAPIVTIPLGNEMPRPKKQIEIEASMKVEKNIISLIGEVMKKVIKTTDQKRSRKKI